MIKKIIAMCAPAAKESWSAATMNLTLDTVKYVDKELNFKLNGDGNNEGKSYCIS